MPSSRPRIVFIGGVCNACLWADAKKEIDWDERRNELIEVVSASERAGPYDCVVPFSGGKDSAAIAWRLKFDFGLNPLLVTYGQLLWTHCGRHNFDQVARWGFDILYWRVNQDVSRKLARRFFIERGHPKQHYDAGVNAVPLITAAKFDIPLVFYAEHGETEYGGLVLGEESRRTRDIVEVLEHQVGDHPANWATDGISRADLHPYIYPDADDVAGVKAFYFSYFFPWDIKENADLCRREMDFQPADASSLLVPRSDGTFTEYDSIDDKIDDLDFYMMHVKFGFGRATRDASRLIQNGHMTRADGLGLVRKFDGEFPSKYWKDVLDYLGMTEDEALAAVDRHRNPEIWIEEDGWKLKYPPM